MKTILRLSLVLLPFAFVPACDDDNDDDDKSSNDSKDNDSKDNDDNDNDSKDNEDNGDGAGQVPLWDCYCEAECDGEILEYEEEVCSDAETLDVAVELSVAACAEEIESDCLDFFCGCECDEDPDLACE